MEAPLFHAASEDEAPRALEARQVLSAEPVEVGFGQGRVLARLNEGPGGLPPFLMRGGDDGSQQYVGVLVQHRL